RSEPDLRRPGGSDTARDSRAARAWRGQRRRSGTAVFDFLAGDISSPSSAGARSSHRAPSRRTATRMPAARPAASFCGRLDRTLSELLGGTARRTRRVSRRSAIHPQEEKTMTARDTLDLTVSRTIRAPRQKVFDAFVKPELLKQWFGPRGFTVTDAAIDPRVDGRYRFSMRAKTGEIHTVGGVYREVAAPERLVFT